MSNIILHPRASNGGANGTTSGSTDERALSDIVKQATASLPAFGADALTTWVSFALMTGHLAFPVCVAIVALADLINAVAAATFRARLVDVQVFLQRRTSRAASGLEGIYGVLLDIDHRVSDALTDIDNAGAPVPAVHWETPRPGIKAAYVWSEPVTEPVFVETAMRLGLHFDHIDPRSWTTSQGQRLPTVIRRNDGRLEEVHQTAYLANATPLSGVVSDVPFPGRVRFALGGSLVSPAQRNEIRTFLESIGIPAPEGPGSHRYRACPDCADHSSECCYVNTADDGAISVVCLAGHGGEGKRTWNEALLLTLASGESVARATRFDLLKDLPVTWSAIELIHHTLRSWPNEERNAVLKVWMAEKARLESPAPEKVNEMLGVYARRLRGEGHFGPVNLYFDARTGGLKYADAAGRTYAINCTAAGPTTKGNAHECGATAAKTLVFDAESGGIVVGWAPYTSSLLNKAVVGQRHALRELGVPVIERHELPVAFDKEEWSVEPRTKIVIAKVPFTFPEGVKPIPALEFFLRIYREGRLPFASENDVRLFVVAIAAPLLRYTAPGLLGVFWFVGPPGAGKDYLAEIPPLIWACVNAFLAAVKFDISVTDDLEQKRSLASAGDAVYGRAKEAGKRPGFVDLLIRFAGTESLPARQVFAPELTVKNTYTILADSAEDIPDRREISRRTVMISVAEIADSVSKGKVLDEIRAAAPGLLLDLLQKVESQPLTAYTQVANANTRPIVPVALARLFGAELPDVRGEDLTDIFDAMLEFASGATGKVEGESERKKAMKRADRESKDAIMIPSYRLSFFIDTVSAQPGYRELFGKYRDKAKELLNRIVREAGYADVRTHKLPYLTVRIGDTNYAFKFVRNNRNFILLPATEYADRMVGVANDAASSSVDPTSAAASQPAPPAPAPSTDTPADAPRSSRTAPSSSASGDAMRVPIEKTVTADFETVVEHGYSLAKMGAPDYVRDPRFAILTVSVAVGGAPIRFFHAAATTPEQSLEAGRTLLARAATDGHVLVAHNIGFDGLVAKFAWDLSFSQYFDTTGYARYLGVGASLENVAALFGYRKLEAPPFTPETLRDSHARSTLARYNAADVAIARLVYRAAFDDHGYPDAEFSINDLTSRMNLEGLRIDTARAAELAAQAATLHASAMSELASSYAFDTSALRRPDAIRAFAKRSWGLSLGSLDKRDVELRSAIRTVQEAERFFRLRDRIHTLSRAVQKLQSYASVEGGRVYGFLRYYGAHTGRFAAGGRDANKFNVHQLFKVKSRARIPELGAERGVVVPPDGNDFVAADLATVEARVVAWVADETALLEQFRLPGTDVYIWFVQQIFVGVRIVKDGENDHLRQLGKETILGLGFGMGYDTFLKKVREAMPEVDAEIVRTLFDAYQASFPRIRAVRYALMSAFARAVSESAVSTIGKCTFEPSSAPQALSPSVIVRLPTGRALYYRSVVIEREPTPFGSRPVFWYAPHANLTRTPARARGKGERLFADGQRRVRLTPQVLVENVVQAIARDVMVHQVLEIARLGLRPAFHAHDEEVFECDACDCVDAAAHRADCPWTTAGALVERVMSDVPSTLPALAGLPLKAELKRSVKERYG